MLFWAFGLCSSNPHMHGMTLPVQNCVYDVWNCRASGINTVLIDNESCEIRRLSRSSAVRVLCKLNHTSCFNYPRLGCVLVQLYVCIRKHGDWILPTSLTAWKFANRPIVVYKKHVQQQVIDRLAVSCSRGNRAQCFAGRPSRFDFIRTVER